MTLADQIEDAKHALETQRVANAATGLADYAALLAYVDTLREAAKKVTCARCGWNVFRVMAANNCPDCSALRAKLQESTNHAL